MSSALRYSRASTSRSPVRVRATTMAASEATGPSPWSATAPMACNTVRSASAPNLNRSTTSGRVRRTSRRARPRAVLRATTTVPAAETASTTVMNGPRTTTIAAVSPSPAAVRHRGSTAFTARTPPDITAEPVDVGRRVADSSEPDGVMAARDGGGLATVTAHRPGQPATASTPRSRSPGPHPPPDKAIPPVWTARSQPHADQRPPPPR